jgi:capsular exopolysaccharide synthesis family protein
MDIQYYLTVLWRRLWIIILVTSIVFVITVVGQRRITPLYTSTATIRLALSLSLTQNSQIYNYNTQLMNTFVALSTSRTVLMELADRLQVKPLPTIEVAAVPNTELVRITTTAPDPKIARLTSNTLAELLIEKNSQLFAGGGVLPSAILFEQIEIARVELEKARGQYATVSAITPTATGQPSYIEEQLSTTNALVQEKQRTYEILLREYEQAQLREALTQNIVILAEEAPLPNEPSQPRTSLNYMIAVLTGLFGGVLLAFIIENTDSRIYAARDIRALVPHLPVIAALPRASRKQLQLTNKRTSEYLEAVRILAVHIQLAGQKSRQNVLVFTGAGFRQGTSLTVANLGSALAEQGRNVLIVDGNSRNPSMHLIFQLSNEMGLIDIVSGKVELKDVIQKTGQENLSLITLGLESAESFSIQDSSAGPLIKLLRQKFDFVLLDAPALSFADVSSLAQFADEIIMVARRSHIKRDALKSAGDFISKFTDKQLGLIINESEARSFSS